MTNYEIHKFPKSRIATIDVCEMGKRKHHVTGLMEFDVSECRRKIREYNRKTGNTISLTAWIIHTVSKTLCDYKTLSSYLAGRNKQMIFNDITVSLIVEKDLNGHKVPIPLLIEKANQTGVEELAKLIGEAKIQPLQDSDIVLRKKTRRMERMYYSLPGFLRRAFWKYLLRNPKLAHKKMGNVAITSVGTMGKVNGWFIPISIHPICFGISSVVKKPVVIDDRIEIREVLNMSVLIDHDVIDGAQMARFIRDLSGNIENGFNL